MQVKTPYLTKLVRNRRLELIEQEISHGMKILDLGCGDGYLTKHLLSKGYDCIGVDKNITNNTYLRCEDISELSFPDNTFDCIIMIEVIEHIEPSNYSEIERVIKPKGKIILTTPLPQFNWLVELLANLGFVNSLKTAHINLVHLSDLPKRWQLIKETRIFMIDQYGVFQVLKPY